MIYNYQVSKRFSDKLKKLGIQHPIKMSKLTVDIAPNVDALDRFYQKFCYQEQGQQANPLHLGQECSIAIFTQE